VWAVRLFLVCKGYFHEVVLVKGDSIMTLPVLAVRIGDANVLDILLKILATSLVRVLR
jgi:hypothetical protein